MPRMRSEAVERIPPARSAVNYLFSRPAAPLDALIDFLWAADVYG
jgi:hypothetical protein